MRLLKIAGLLVGLAGTFEAAAELRTTHVAGNVYMISGAGGNIAASVGPSGIMIVDTGAGGTSEAVLAELRKLSNGTLRFIINTSVASDRIGGNGALRAAGATFTGGNAGIHTGAAIIAHESALHRLATTSDVPAAAHPTETFYVQRTDYYFNNEPVVLSYHPRGVDDTNLSVHFRSSDVIVTGDLFRLDQYPYIDLEKGGSVAGVLDALNDLIDLAVSGDLAERGTLLIPGHGRICDEADLVRYRDMVTVIRDRVKTLRERGYSLAQIKAAKPTLDYESRFGTNPKWTGEHFIEAVYASLGS